MAEENVKNHTQEKVENKQQEETVNKENNTNQVEETEEKEEVVEDKPDGKEEKESSGNKKKSKKEKKQIEELQTKLVELSDKHLRLQAEFDNFRRRTLKEKAELIKSGGESTIITLLPIIDDFERALESLKEIPDDDSGKQGTMLIYTKFKDFLKQNNVKEIDALNQDFDVDLHEAVTKIPAPEKKLKGKVVDVIQKGYLLNDKVIRFAKVVVGE